MILEHVICLPGMDFFHELNQGWQRAMSAAYITQVTSVMSEVQQEV